VRRKAAAMVASRLPIVAVRNSKFQATSTSTSSSRSSQLYSPTQPTPTLEETEKSISATRSMGREDAKSSRMTYPPPLSDEQYASLVSDIKDWQITHGSLLKLVQTDEENTVKCHPVGTTLFPTLFPKELFHDAHALQKAYNKLYAAVAEDDEWLFDVLKELFDVDDLASALWEIYQEVKEEGFVQDLTLGIFRSDYMMHVNPIERSHRPELKQVELNTVSCAGGVHTNRVSDMHRHLHRTGAYQPLVSKDTVISS
jgi:hypothetical protein